MSDPGIPTGLPEAVRAAVPEDLVAALVALRHDLHRHPELAFEEHRTVARLARALDELVAAPLAGRGAPGLAVRRVAGTGLVARLPGRDRTAPTVAIRGDIDALPIAEETGAAFASRVPGRMHACGHDVHASWALGAAALLARRPPAGDVVLVLQPAEEIARGARAVLDAGGLDGVAAIFGGHVDLRFPLGEAVVQPGPLAASADTFSIVLEGEGAHGARPHEGVDPVVGAAALVLGLQTVVSRRLAPGTPAVVTVGRIEAGNAPNVIPESARLAGTLRATDPVTRRTLVREVGRLADGVGRAHRLGVRVAWEEGPPPLVNSEREAAWARRAVEECLGAEAVVPLPEVNLAGEDFADYLERVPGCFLRLGARRPEAAPVPAHSPRFLPDDGAVACGALVLSEVARRASAELAGQALSSE